MAVGISILVRLMLERSLDPCASTGGGGGGGDTLRRSVWSLNLVSQSLQENEPMCSAYCSLVHVRPVSSWHRLVWPVTIQTFIVISYTNSFFLHSWNSKLILLHSPGEHNNICSGFTEMM